MLDFFRLPRVAADHGDAEDFYGGRLQESTIIDIWSDPAGPEPSWSMRMRRGAAGPLRRHTAGRPSAESVGRLCGWAAWVESSRRHSASVLRCLLKSAGSRNGERIGSSNLLHSWWARASYSKAAERRGAESSQRVDRIDGGDLRLGIHGRSNQTKWRPERSIL